MESPQEGQPVYRRRRQQMLSDPPADKAFSEGEGQRKLSISCSPTEGTILLCGDKTIGRLPDESTVHEARTGSHIRDVR